MGELRVNVITTLGGALVDQVTKWLCRGVVLLRYRCLEGSPDPWNVAQG